MKINLTELAKEIGVTRTSVYNFIKELELDKDNLSMTDINKLRDRAKGTPGERFGKASYGMKYGIKVRTQNDLLKLIQYSLESDIEFTYVASEIDAIMQNKKDMEGE